MCSDLSGDSVRLSQAVSELNSDSLLRIVGNCVDMPVDGVRSLAVTQVMMRQVSASVRV